MNLLDRTLTKQRPIPINVLAILMLIGFIVSLRNISSMMDGNNTLIWYYYFSIAISVLSLVTAIGLLMMKRFAVYVYITYIPISLYTQYSLNNVFNIYGVVFAGIFILIMLKYFKQME